MLAAPEIAILRAVANRGEPGSEPVTTKRKHGVCVADIKFWNAVLVEQRLYCLVKNTLFKRVKEHQPAVEGRCHVSGNSGVSATNRVCDDCEVAVCVGHPLCQKVVRLIPRDRNKGLAD